MKISEYRHIARKNLKGCYCEAFIVTALCLFVYLSFKAAELLMAYFWSGYAGSLISGLLKAAVTALCFLLTTPLLTGGFWWFFQTACGEDNRSLLKLYSGFRLNCRAALLYAAMWIKSFFSLFPTAFCWTAAYVLLYGNTGLSESFTVFAAFQFFMLGIFLIGLYFSTAASMALAPFMFIGHPDKNPLKVLKESSVCMKGKKLEFIRLILSFVPAMLPVVTIPFVIPSAVMAAAVFAQKNSYTDISGRDGNQLCR